MFGKWHGNVAVGGRPDGAIRPVAHRTGNRALLRQRRRRVDKFNPSLRDNTTLVPQSKDPDYCYPTDMTDKAIAWIKTQKSLTPDKPSSSTIAALGTHDPVQGPESWRDKYKGRFDMGWDKAREETLARQKKLGIVPAHTRLAPRPDIVKDWDTLSADEKKVCVRHQEVVRGVCRDDRLRDRPGRAGHRRHGGAGQHPDRLCHRRQRRDRQRRDARLLQSVVFLQPGAGDLARPARASGRVRWAALRMTATHRLVIADNTPFTETQFNTRYGGITNGAVISWPKGIKARGEIRSQYHHVMDVAPTVLEAEGCRSPRSSTAFPRSRWRG